MSIPPEVELRLSGDLFGGNPRGLLNHLGLYGRPMGDNRWMVRPNEEKSFFRSLPTGFRSVPKTFGLCETLPTSSGVAQGCRLAW